MALAIAVGLLPFLIYGMAKRNLFSVQLLFVLCLFQNIVVVMISPYIDKTDYNMLVLIKEIYVVLTILIGIVAVKKISKFELYCYFCIILLLICAVVHSEGTIMQVLVSIRQLYLPFLFYLFARQIKVTESELKKLIKVFCVICIIGCCFGFLELFVGDSFWQLLHIKDYMWIKLGKVQVVNGYYNMVSMYSYDLFPLLHKMVRRMSSILADPVIWSQIIALAVLYIFGVPELFKKQKTWFWVIGISLILTLGKGGIIIAALTGAVIVKTVYKQRQIGNVLITIGVFVFFYAMVFSVDEGTSGGAHLEGLISHIKNWPTYPIGKGIGTEGNLAINMAGLETENSGESFIGTVIGQLGIGVFLYMIFFNWLRKNVNSTVMYTETTNRILNVTNIATWMMFLTSFINNTAISFTSCFVYIIILGLKIVPNKIQCEENEI